MYPKTQNMGILTSFAGFYFFLSNKLSNLKDINQFSEMTDFFEGKQ